MVLELQKMFLGEIKSEQLEILDYKDGTKISKETGNLVLSNYALSEVNRELQVEYFKKIVSNIGRGYLTWNALAEKQLGGLTIRDLQSFIPDSHVIQEFPLTAEGNVIIYWGSKAEFPGSFSIKDFN
jgi:hypothetical protein